MKQLNTYAPTTLRLVLGLLFIVPGISKLLNPSGIIGMLRGIGFPVPNAVGWIVLLSEIIFGLAILVGYQVKYTVWPLIIVLLVAIVTVHLPGLAANPMGIINVLFHLLGIAALLSVYLTGAGALAIDKH